MKPQVIFAWILACALLSATGRFVDYLLSTGLRKDERRKVQVLFGRLYDAIDRVNITHLQLLLVDLVLKGHRAVFGPRVFSLRSLSLSLLASQYLTLTAWWITVVLHPNLRLAPVGLLFAIPFWPFLGGQFLLDHPVGSTVPLEQFGLFWNNCLFDVLSIAATGLLLIHVQKRRRQFVFVAMTDVGLSYSLAYAGLWLYVRTPPNAGDFELPFLQFIPLFWSLGIGDSSLSLMVLCVSLTTFVPVAAYMSLLFLLSILKAIQWVAATVAWDFARDNEKTAFFKLGTALGVCGLLVKAAHEFVKLMVGS